MKIISIIENTSKNGLPVEHGLSLYIEKNDGQRVLFDMGQSALFARNAKTLGLNIANIDIAVISHGHYDHGGGLKTFLAENDRAPIYIHRDAFLPHYSLRETGLRYIGLDNALKDNERFVCCTNKTSIGQDMVLFANVHGDCCVPTGNRLLFGPAADERDTFSHEQSLIIEEAGKVILLAGCAHCGIINIMRKAQEVTGKVPTHVFAGMHLVKSGLCETEESAMIASLAKELKRYEGTTFYTMHCTGEEQFVRLKAMMGSQIEYLSCGDYVILSQ